MHTRERALTNLYTFLFAKTFVYLDGARQTTDRLRERSNFGAEGGTPKGKCYCEAHRSLVEGCAQLFKQPRDVRHEKQSGQAVEADAYGRASTAS